jgi:uncharacterized membrane protein
MAKDVKDTGDAIGAALGTIVREIGQSVSSNGHKGAPWRGSDFSGARGVAAGAVLATAAPIAGKVAGKAAKKLVVQGAKGAVGKGAKQVIGKKLPGFGGKSKAGKGQKGVPGVGKGRRMPVQQTADIGVPLSVAYNQWTQFEEWPQFMHRFDQVTQEDDSTVSFKTKIWGMSKEFDAQIVEQRPDERIQWNVDRGVTHTGVVTFHELAPRLTRVQVSLDVEPGSWIEKFARGMRHVKRAVRADLARFKAFIEVRESETGAWRGVIHNGRVVRRREPRRRTPQRRRRGSSSGSARRRRPSRRRSSARS